ncbi:RING finger protein 225-like isoform X1 [Acipenser oxyrinchus oxyrinchus]|uniref:RING finger protein 225-like isoform X1 n=1 Tax=Acipenser oxyrinchus oxyrinchus TaxID=40147 RepID=A0AAD8FQC2_ACIOX|nr:RING finger protein 225-like isoform X1 [Acipenser oxyrinchus oxyrinchus]
MIVPALLPPQKMCRGVFDEARNSSADSPHSRHVCGKANSLNQFCRRILSALTIACKRTSATANATERPAREEICFKNGVVLEHKAKSGSGEPSLLIPCPSCEGPLLGKVRRLACGHSFCRRCALRIVDEAFRDIEGLSNFPCPVCNSLPRPEM